ncbi:hypothetical protein [Rhodococcoides fascians]|uniref:hypothetical protein n=1 Tax=Rhodococcoides fascians TaxID=1828 RepID=UPI00055AF4E9|nr:hypothetical protein [Rhodococcus fascians]
MSNYDHLDAATNAANVSDISSSLAHSSIASVQALRAIDSRLDAVVEVATSALGVLLDGRDVENALDTETGVRVRPSVVADPEAARRFRIEQLGDHLQAVYDAATTTPIWPVLAEAAIDWMEK